MKVFLIKVGQTNSPPVRALSHAEVRLFLTGLLMGDGRGEEQAREAARSAADHLLKGGRYIDQPITHLFSDDRPVRAWWWEETA